LLFGSKFGAKKKGQISKITFGPGMPSLSDNLGFRLLTQAQNDSPQFPPYFLTAFCYIPAPVAAPTITITREATR
jgi:hypothetical protein